MDVIGNNVMIPINNITKYLSYKDAYISLSSVSKNINEHINESVPLLNRLIKIQDKIIHSYEWFVTRNNRQLQFNKENLLNENVNNKYMSIYATCFKKEKDVEEYLKKYNLDAYYDYNYAKKRFDFLKSKKMYIINKCLE